jgi:PIN domain nuclease of toxin-antitoxin system
MRHEANLRSLSEQEFQASTCTSWESEWLYLSNLPFHHKDPFDRLMIAQSFSEDIPLVTKDSTFGAYGVRTIW